MCWPAVCLFREEMHLHLVRLKLNSTTRTVSMESEFKSSPKQMKSLAGYSSSQSEFVKETDGSGN
jgi:hypothetical protein